MRWTSDKRCETVQFFRTFMPRSLAMYSAPVTMAMSCGMAAQGFRVDALGQASPVELQPKRQNRSSMLEDVMNLSQVLS